jgi:hypothetical protein
MRPAWTVDDLHRECLPSLYSDAMSPTTTYFWSHLVSRRTTTPLRDNMMRALQDCRTPRVYHAQAGTVAVFSVRGTSTKRDIRVDLKTKMSDGRFRKRVADAVAGGHEAVRRQVESTAELVIERGWRVHRGMFVRAASVALAVVRAAPPGTTALRLYGHSLGGACASMALAWLRAAGGFADVRASVMSSPDFCDDACRAGWLAEHDHPDVFRHYHTRNDPLVHKLPRMAGLGCGLSAAPFVCPMPAIDKSNPAVRVLGSLLAHVMYDATRFVRQDGGKSGRTGVAVAVGCEGAKVLTASRYMHYVAPTPRSPTPRPPTSRSRTSRPRTTRVASSNKRGKAV